jgi:hypothetical protein
MSWGKNIAAPATEIEQKVTTWLEDVRKYNFPEVEFALVESHAKAAIALAKDSPGKTVVMESNGSWSTYQGSGSCYANLKLYSI